MKWKDWGQKEVIPLYLVWFCYRRLRPTDLMIPAVKTCWASSAASLGRWCWRTWSTARKPWRRSCRRPQRWETVSGDIRHVQWVVLFADFAETGLLTTERSAVLHRKRVWRWRRTSAWRVVCRQPRPRWVSGRPALRSRTTRRWSSCWRLRSETWRTSWPVNGKHEEWRPPRSVSSRQQFLFSVQSVYW